MNVVISDEKIWRGIIRFAWRRIVKPGGKIPDGVPTIRDAEARCEAYSPRKRSPRDWDCQGDGHYLCDECAFHVKEAVDAEEGPE
jgi:hypothetical protein